MGCPDEHGDHARGAEIKSPHGGQNRGHAQGTNERHDVRRLREPKLEFHRHDSWEETESRKSRVVHSGVKVELFTRGTPRTRPRLFTCGAWVERPRNTSPVRCLH